MKFIFILLTTTFLHNNLFALDLSCNPNANCMMAGPNYPCGTWGNPFRTCPSAPIENPACAVARKLCQVSCTQKNSDASGYIARDNERIRQIDTTLAQNNALIVNLNFAIKSNDDLFASQNSICVDIQNSQNTYLKDVTTQRAFVATLDDISATSNTTTIKTTIDSNPKLTPKEKTILKNFIDVASLSPTDLPTLISQFKKDVFDSFDKVLSKALDNSVVECESQKTQISNQKGILVGQINKTNTDNGPLIDERQNKLNDIQVQEQRKCPPW